MGCILFSYSCIYSCYSGILNICVVSFYSYSWIYSCYSGIFNICVVSFYSYSWIYSCYSGILNICVVSFYAYSWIYSCYSGILNICVVTFYSSLQIVLLDNETSTKLYNIILRIYDYNIYKSKTTISTDITLQYLQI